MASNWCPADICPSHVIAQAAVISSIILFLLVIGVLICLAAYYSDVLRLAWRRLRPLENSSWNSGRRSTRTAQEIYDECAALLHDDTSFSSSHLAGNSHTTEDTDVTSQGAPNKQYPHQITTSFQEPTLKKMLKNSSYVGVVLSLFLLSSVSVVLQFYSSPYLSDVIHIDNSTGIKVQGNGIDLTHWEAPLDVRHVFGVKINGLGVFLYNGIFIIVYLKRTTISNNIKTEWKPWVMPVMLLVVAISAVITGAVGNIIAFLVTALTASFVKVVETVLLHTMVSQLTRTWPPVDLTLTNAPTTLLWSLLPLSLLVSSLIVSSIYDTTCFSAVPMYFIAVFSILAGLTFLVLRNKVI